MSSRVSGSLTVCPACSELTRSASLQMTEALTRLTSTATSSPSVCNRMWWVPALQPHALQSLKC